MVYEPITDEMIQWICDALAFYDQHRRLPDQAKRVEVTMPAALVVELHDYAQSSGEKVSHLMSIAATNLLKARKAEQ